MAKYDLFTGMGLMLLSAIMYRSTLTMAKVRLGIGPGDYPRVIASILFVLGGMLAVRSLFALRSGHKRIFEPKALGRVVGTVAVTFGYIRLMRDMGFIYTTPIYLLFLLTMFGYKRKIPAVAISICTTFALYWVFRSVFQVLLPEFSLF